MLKVFFTVVYFLICLFVLNLFFRNTIGLLADILAVVCMIVALITSVGVADYTVEKIKDKYRKQ